MILTNPMPNANREMHPQPGARCGPIDETGRALLGSRLAIWLQRMDQTERSSRPLSAGSGDERRLTKTNRAPIV